MRMNLERRLTRIMEKLSTGYSDISFTTDDDLARIITGNPCAKASNISDNQLELIVLGEDNGIKPTIAKT